MAAWQGWHDRGSQTAAGKCLARAKQRDQNGLRKKVEWAGIAATAQGGGTIELAFECRRGCGNTREPPRNTSISPGFTLALGGFSSPFCFLFSVFCFGSVVALMWLWCGFGVALWELCGSFVGALGWLWSRNRLAINKLSGGFDVALDGFAQFQHCSFCLRVALGGAATQAIDTCKLIRSGRSHYHVRLAPLQDFPQPHSWPRLHCTPPDQGSKVINFRHKALVRIWSFSVTDGHSLRGVRSISPRSNNGRTTYPSRIHSSLS